MGACIVFYRLGAKFLDSEDDIPKEAGDVLYYTLAVGHHTGIIDCFEEALSCSLECYGYVVSLVGDPDAHHKLSGLLEFGEIQVDKTHVDILLGPLRTLRYELRAEAADCDFPEIVALPENVGASRDAKAPEYATVNENETAPGTIEGPESTRARKKACGHGDPAGVEPVETMETLREEARMWVDGFTELLIKVHDEPSMYLMGRWTDGR